VGIVNQTKGPTMLLEEKSALHKEIFICMAMKKMHLPSMPFFLTYPYGLKTKFRPLFGT
jgi:hypothetical protein